MRRYTLLLTLAIICAFIFVLPAAAASRDGPGERGLSAKANSAPSAVVVATGGTAADRVLQTAVAISPKHAGADAVVEIRWLQRFNEQGRKLYAYMGSDIGLARATMAKLSGAARYPLAVRV